MVYVGNWKRLIWGNVTIPKGVGGGGETGDGGRGTWRSDVFQSVHSPGEAIGKYHTLTQRDIQCAYLVIFRFTRALPSPANISCEDY